MKDLSCPFVDEKTACDLFEMCLTIFLETRGDVGRIVALDEAHKVRAILTVRDKANSHPVHERCTVIFIIVH